MSEEESEYIVRSISFTREVLEKADLIVKKRLIAGINNRSGLVEYALRKVFQEVFKKDSPNYSVAPEMLKLQAEKERADQ